MIGRLLSVWEGLFSGAMLISGSVNVEHMIKWFVMSFEHLLGSFTSLPENLFWLSFPQEGHRGKWPCLELVALSPTLQRN